MEYGSFSSYSLPGQRSGTGFRFWSELIPELHFIFFWWKQWKCFWMEVSEEPTVCLLEGPGPGIRPGPVYFKTADVLQDLSASCLLPCDLWPSGHQSGYMVTRTWQVPNITGEGLNTPGSLMLIVLGTMGTFWAEGEMCSELRRRKSSCLKSLHRCVSADVW